MRCMNFGDRADADATPRYRPIPLRWHSSPSNTYALLSVRRWESIQAAGSRSRQSTACTAHAANSLGRSTLQNASTPETYPALHHFRRCCRHVLRNISQELRVADVGRQLHQPPVHCAWWCSKPTWRHVLRLPGIGLAHRYHDGQTLLKHIKLCELHWAGYDRIQRSHRARAGVRRLVRRSEARTAPKRCLEQRWWLRPQHRRCRCCCPG